MKEKNQIRAVAMVRRIRDEQAAILSGKSNAEIMNFFKKASDAARKEALRRRTDRAKVQQSG